MKKNILFMLSILSANLAAEYAVDKAKTLTPFCVCTQLQTGGSAYSRSTGRQCVAPISMPTAGNCSAYAISQSSSPDYRIQCSLQTFYGSQQPYFTCQKPLTT